MQDRVLTAPIRIGDLQALRARQKAGTTTPADEQALVALRQANQHVGRLVAGLNQALAPIRDVHETARRIATQYAIMREAHRRIPPWGLAQRHRRHVILPRPRTRPRERRPCSRRPRAPARAAGRRSPGRSPDDQLPDERPPRRAAASRYLSGLPP